MTDDDRNRMEQLSLMAHWRVKVQKPSKNVPKLPTKTVDNEPPSRRGSAPSSMQMRFKIDRKKSIHSIHNPETNEFENPRSQNRMSPYDRRNTLPFATRSPPEIASPPPTIDPGETANNSQGRPRLLSCPQLSTEAPKQENESSSKEMQGSITQSNVQKPHIFGANFNPLDVKTSFVPSNITDASILNARRYSVIAQLPSHPPSSFTPHQVSHQSEVQMDPRLNDALKTTRRMGFVENQLPPLKLPNSTLSKETLDESTSTTAKTDPEFNKLITRFLWFSDKKEKSPPLSPPI